MKLQHIFVGLCAVILLPSVCGFAIRTREDKLDMVRRLEALDHALDELIDHGQEGSSSSYKRNEGYRTRHQHPQDGPVPYRRNEDGSIPYKRNEDGSIPYKRNEDGSVPYKRNEDGLVPYKRNEDGLVPYKRVEANARLDDVLELLKRLDARGRHESTKRDLEI